MPRLQVSCPPERRGALRDLVSIFRADILDVGSNSVIVEILGKEDKILALTKLLDEFGEWGALGNMEWNCSCGGAATWSLRARKCGGRKVREDMTLP